MTAIAVKDKWIVRASENVGCGGAVRTEHTYWTGGAWDTDPGRARLFDSKRDVDVYIVSRFPKDAIAH